MNQGDGGNTVPFFLRELKMAMSAMFVLSVKRMVERLKDPYFLNKAEQAKLDAMLTADQLVDVARRAEAIREQLDFDMTDPGLDGHAYIARIRENDRLNDSIILATRDTGRAVNGIAKARQNISDLRKNGTKNPKYLEAAEADLKKWTELLDGYVSSVRLRYEALDPELRRRFWDHRGEFKLDNLPRPNPGDKERVFWPERPIAIRQAYIEVLEAKIATPATTNDDEGEGG